MQSSDSTAETVNKFNLIGAFENSDEYEQVIIDNGHRLNNCEWMAHEIAGIIKNNDGSYGKL